MLSNGNNENLNNLKCVLVDVDNTLLDFDKSSQLATILTCEDFSIEYTQTMFDAFLKVNNDMWRQIQDGKLTKKQLWQTRWNTIFNMVGIVADGPAFETEFHRHLHDCAILIDGAVEALKYLHSKYTVCTASNASFAQQYHRLKISGLLKYIDKVFVSEHLGAQKPSAEFFEACFKELGFPPQSTLMIGDDIHADMLGAYKYGIHTCWFNPQRASNNENIPLDFIIYNLSDIKKLI